MRRGLALGLLLGWLLGIATGLLDVVVTGGSYEHLVVGPRSLLRFVNDAGGQVIQIIPDRDEGRFTREDSIYLRRPRVRLP